MLYFDDSRLIGEEHFISLLWVLRIWGLNFWVLGPGSGVPHFVDVATMK